VGESGAKLRAMKLAGPVWVSWQQGELRFLALLGMTTVFSPQRGSIDDFAFHLLLAFIFEDPAKSPKKV
jgi:hypothetical protein